MLALALCFALNLTYDVDTSLIWIGVVGGLAGLAIGVTVAPTTAAVMATLPMDRIGAGSAVNNALRQVGSVLGVAVLGTIVSSTYQHRIAPSLAGLPDNSPGSRGDVRRGDPARRGRDRPARTWCMSRTTPSSTPCTPRPRSPPAIVLVGAIVLTLAFRVTRRTPEVPRTRPPVEV